MTTSFANEIEHYENYARHCLTLASQNPHRGARLILREMAAEWLKLALSSGLDDETPGRVSPSNGAHLSD